MIDNVFVYMYVFVCVGETVCFVMVTVPGYGNSDASSNR